MTDLSSLLRTPEPGGGKAIAWQVGRQGEVAGGMTQVVNGYVGWSFSRFEVKVISSRDGGRGLRALRLFAQALRQLARLADPRREMVVVHLSQGGSFVREGLLLWLARRRGFGTVAHLHGSRFVDFAARRPWLVRRVLQAADQVIVLSEATAQVAQRMCASGRVVLLPNAVPAGAPRAKEPLMVFGGSVSRRKGVDVLLEAWRRADPSPTWRLVVAGPIADVQPPAGAVPGVEFVGPIAHSDLMNLLDRSAVAVLPSRDEAMPMFILEALARHNCVISTIVGGIPAVLGGGRGVLVPPGDTDGLAAAIRQVVDGPAFRQQVADAGSLAFEREFSAAAVYPRVEQVWAGVLADFQQ